MIDSLININDFPVATVGETTEDSEMVDFSTLRGKMEQYPGFQYESFIYIK